MPNRDIIDGCSVHRMAGHGTGVHKEYGLWICGFGSHVSRADPLKAGGLRYFEYYSLSHMYDGSGGLWMGADGPKQPIRPGDCVLMTPFTVHRYGASGGAYHEDTVCFSGKRADQLAACGVIRPGIYRMGPARRVRQVMRLAQDPARESQVEANIELERLLFDVYAEGRLAGVGKQDVRVAELIVRFKQDLSRWWSIEEMAEFCNLTRDHFRRLFLRETGENPKVYLDRLRFAKAQELLASSSLSVTELSARFGYSDPYHFSRRFKTLCGMAPDHYRRQFPGRA